MYDLMIAAIVVSLAPLRFKEKYPAFHITDLAVTMPFIVNYLLRWEHSRYRDREGQEG